MARKKAEVGVVKEGQVADLVRHVRGRVALGRRLARVQDAQVVVLSVGWLLVD
jgi:hypothetical protein